jgi:arylsulfatase A-like enzyme
MNILDQEIGVVLAALRSDVAQNTIIVFASDHGEYASAHGFVSGKACSCYEEVYNVPLIVMDPSDRFTPISTNPTVRHHGSSPGLRRASHLAAWVAISASFR